MGDNPRSRSRSGGQHAWWQPNIAVPTLIASAILKSSFSLSLLLLRASII